VGTAEASEPTTDNDAGVRHFDGRGWEEGEGGMMVFIPNTVAGKG